MKLLSFFCLCLVAVNANQVIVKNSGYYWRDWNVKEAIPADAVPGGINRARNKTYIARTPFLKTGGMVLGQADPSKQKMVFESDNVEYESTKDISILCSLSHKRLSWVYAKKIDLVSSVENNQKLLVTSGTEGTRRVVIGKAALTTEVQIGKVFIDDVTDQFSDLIITVDATVWKINEGYEVLVYDNTPNNSDKIILEFP